MKIAENCDFDTIMPDKILRDQLGFGIGDAKTRMRLLREAKLTLQRTDEICHAAESMSVQMKVVEESNPEPSVSAIQSNKGKTKKPESAPDSRRGRECWNCCKRHDLQQRELCPVCGKACCKYHKMNHFAAKCCSKGSLSVRPVTSTGTEGQEDTKEIFPPYWSTTNLDDSQLVTLWLEAGSHIRFQVDTGAQCNVLPVSVYKKATKDSALTQVSPSQMRIIAYGGTTQPIVGTVLL